MSFLFNEVVLKIKQISCFKEEYYLASNNN
jgi:hypothetical protein